MTKPLDDDAIRQAIDAESMAQRRRIDTFIRVQGHNGLADELKVRLKEVDLGLDGARMTWSSISEAQRRLLLMLFNASALVRVPNSPTRYEVQGAASDSRSRCGIATARSLCGRDLIHCDGTVFDPEGRFVLTERGRFVVKHGLGNSSL